MTHVVIPDTPADVTYSSVTGTGPLIVPFPIFDKVDLRVSVNGVEIAQSQFAYTATSSTTGGFQTGTISLVASVTAATVRVWRDVRPERVTDFNSGPLPRESVNTALDRLNAQDQDIRRWVARVEAAGLPALPPAIIAYAGIAGLRANSAIGPTVAVLVSNWTPGDGGGVFRLDASDTTSADNGGTVIVDAAGYRWKRQVSGGALRASWFGATEAALQACIVAAEATTRHVVIDRDYTITSGLIVSVSGLLIEGEGDPQSATPTLTAGASITILTINGSLTNSTSGTGATIRNLRFTHNQDSGRALYIRDHRTRVEACRFFSNSLVNATSLVYSIGSFTDITSCIWDMYPGTWPTGSAGAIAPGRFALEFDRINVAGRTWNNNIESKVRDCEFHGMSSGLLIQSSDATPRPEGVLVAGNAFVCFGTFQLRVRCVLYLSITDNMFDQGGGRCIEMHADAQAIDTVHIANNWISATNGTDAVRVTPGGGLVARLALTGNTFAFCPIGISCSAANVDHLTVADNTFTQVTVGVIATGPRFVLIRGNQFNISAGGSNFQISDNAGAGGPFTITDNRFDPARTFTHTFTARANFTWNGNQGLFFSRMVGVIVPATSGASVRFLLPHFLSTTPALGKTLITWTQDPAGGAHLNVQLRIESVDATNFVIEALYTVVSPGNLFVQVRCEA